MKKILVVAILALLSACFTGSGKDLAATPISNALCFYPCVVEVTGVLMTQEHWGPPNFGETPKEDSRITTYVLKLDQPANVKVPTGSGGTSILKGIDEIQINFPVKASFSKFVGQHVTVKGELIEGLAPSQYTKVVIIVQSIVHSPGLGPRITSVVRHSVWRLIGDLRGRPFPGCRWRWRSK